MVNDQGLYQASLSEGKVSPTRSYQIGSLFYVAFFGGVIALTVLAVKNAKSLQLNNNVVRLMIILGALVLVGKIIFYYAFFQDMIHIEQRYIRYLARAAEIALFGGFYYLMKDAFQRHMLLHGETDKLLKEGIIWCLVSALVEGIIIFTLAAL